MVNEARGLARENVNRQNFKSTLENVEGIEQKNKPGREAHATYNHVCRHLDFW